jgi:hypothetical protein
MSTAVDEIIEASLNEIEGVEALAEFDKKGLLADVADTPGEGFGDGYVKEYRFTSAGLAAMAEDWGTGSATYKAFAKAKQQNKKPTVCQVIKRGALDAEEQTITFSGALQTNEDIDYVVNGVAGQVPWNTSSSQTITDFCTELETIEGVASADVTGQVVTLVAANEWTIPVDVSCSGVESPRTVQIVVTEEGNTAAHDLANALTDVDLSDWYILSAAQSHKGMNICISHYIESLGGRYFILKTNESTVLTGGNTTNTGTRLSTLGYKRTFSIWHHIMSEHISSAFGAYMLAVKAGQFQAQHKNLVGITPTPITEMSASQVTVAQGRNMNTYRKIGTKGQIQPGVRADGKPGEMTKDLDYALNKYVESIYNFMTSPDKVDYDDVQRGLLQGVIETVNGDMVSARIARGDRDTSAVVTAEEDQSPSDVTAGYFDAEATFYYRRGASKVRFILNSIFGAVA